MIKLDPDYQKRISNRKVNGGTSGSRTEKRFANSNSLAKTSKLSRSREHEFASPCIDEAFQNQLSQIPLLSKDEEFELAQRISRFRIAFQRMILKEPAVLEFLTDLLSQWTAKRIRLDSFCNVALSETKKRKTLEPGLKAALPKLTRLVVAIKNESSKSVLRDLHRQTVSLVERLAFRPKSFELAPYTNPLAEGIHLQYKTLCRELTESNLRLVAQTARKICGKSPAMMDMIQEGTQGLMHAVVKFDHSRNLRFSTYAIPWIRQYIFGALSNYDRNIRVPDSFRNVSNRVLAATQQARIELESQHSDSSRVIAEVSRALNLEPGLIARHLQSKRSLQSLDQPKLGEGGSVLAESLTCDFECPQTAAQSNERHRITFNLLAQALCNREREVIQLRYGFQDGHTRSLAEVSRKMGITRERVRQIEKPALEKLRSIRVFSSLQ